MNNFLSRLELNKIGEGLLEVYAKNNISRVEPCVDIKHFITDFLNLRIAFASFAEPDAGRIGFLSDGEVPLLIHQNGETVSAVFPKDTIVLDHFLKANKERGRRRFTLAHEASHHILKRMQPAQTKAAFHTEFDNERIYTKKELSEMFATIEWQADALAAALLMPRALVEHRLTAAGLKQPIKIYDNMVFSTNDKLLIYNIAKILGVSYTAFVIRLRDLDLLEYCRISEFIETELHLGGVQ